MSTQEKIKSFIDKAHRKLLRSQEALSYLEKRGVTKEQIERYKFGFSLTKKMGIPEFDKWSFNGDRLKNRLIFPIKNSLGDYKAFGTRLNNKDSGGYQYFYFDKIEATFFGMENLKSIWEKGYCYITEGIFDHLVLEHLYDNCICPLTANLKQGRLKFLSRFADTIIFAFDADSTGIEKIKQISQNEDLNHLTFYQFSNYRSVGENVKDLNNIWQVLGESKFKDFIERQNDLFVF